MGSLRRHVWPVVALVAAVFGLAAGPAAASTASEEQQGAALVKALDSGQKTCASLSDRDFERIGEYAMGLNFPTVAQHEAMNERMRSMMGVQGEEQAHQAMGRAYAGCATGAQGRRSGGGMMGGGGYGAGMMGGGGYGLGMMGANARGANARSVNGDDGWSPAAVVVIAVLAAGLGAATVALVMSHGRRGGPAAGAP